VRPARSVSSKNASQAWRAADALAKKKIVLRELKETNFRLRVLRAVDILGQPHHPIIDESAELVKILATIIRKARSS
jgi:hypothetical protein